MRALVRIRAVSSCILSLYDAIDPMVLSCIFWMIACALELGARRSCMARRAASSRALDDSSR